MWKERVDVVEEVAMSCVFKLVSSLLHRKVEMVTLPVGDTS